MKKWPVILFAVLTLWGSTLHSLWGDEAETALYARSILSYGIPYGWDGVNIMGHTDAVSLNSDLVNYSNPWPQYYVAALSFLVLGESAFAARLPFVILSIASIFVLYRLVKQLTGSSAIANLAIIISSVSVQFILFSYQARYYSLIVFSGLVFTLASLRIARSQWARVLFVLSGTLFAYSHYISFPLWFVALFAVAPFVVIEKKQRKLWFLWYAGLGVLIALLFSPWWFVLRPYESRGSTLPLPNVGAFLQLWWTQITWAFGPLSRGNIAPLGMLPLSLSVWFFNRSTRAGRVLLFSLLLPTAYLVFAALLTVLFVADNPFTALRYNVIVMPFFLLSIVLVLRHMYLWRKTVGITACVLFVATNIFALQPLKSYPALFVYELTHPYKTHTDFVAQYLREHARDGDTAFVNMDRDHEPLIFLLGKKIRFVNRISPGNSRLFPHNRNVLPRYVSLYFDDPDWVILASKYRTNNTFFTFDRRDVFPGVDLENDYEEIILPVYFADRTRPELDVHSFRAFVPAPHEQVFIYRRLNRDL